MGQEIDIIKNTLDTLVNMCQERSREANVLMDSLDKHFDYYSKNLRTIKDWVLFDLYNMSSILVVYKDEKEPPYLKSSELYRNWVERGKPATTIVALCYEELDFLFGDVALDFIIAFPPCLGDCSIDECISQPWLIPMPSILVLSALDALVLDKKRSMFYELYFECLELIGQYTLAIRKDFNFCVDGSWLSDLIAAKKLLWFETIRTINPDVPVDNKRLEERLTAAQNDDLSELTQELDSLIGLDNIKNDVVSLINLLKIRKLRKENGMPQQSISLHMVFMGNPGTGKTIVARLLAKIYKSLNVLSKGQLVEVDRSGLVGGYVGQTALKVNEVIESAKGGVLFIDEAYSLVSGGDSDYGKEAINSLLKAMEDNRDDLIVIVAGYPELMEKFLSSNPGLRSRFNKFMYFADYVPDDLLEILMLFAAKEGLVLSDEAQWKARAYFTRCTLNNSKDFANARGARNYFEKAITNQANRLARLSNFNQKDLSIILADDLED